MSKNPIKRINLKLILTISSLAIPIFLHSRMSLFDGLETAQVKNPQEEEMLAFIISLSIILFISLVVGHLSFKIGIPKVVGQILAGVLISPTAIGSIKTGFFFNLGITQAGSSYPISTELYTIATIASIILLFSAGLETDFKLFLKFLPKGGLIGFVEVIGTFICMLIISSIIFNVEIISPTSLFIATIATPTSAGICISILASRKKMSSSEGVTIISVSIIDDLLSIVMLTSVISVLSGIKTGRAGSIDWNIIRLTTIKSLLTWALLTIIIIGASKHIAKFLKNIKNFTTFSIVALTLAIFIGGLFEKFGLSMVIGAYIFGLSLSKTDISNIIQEKLSTIERFFIPIFFTSMGMMADLSTLTSKEVLIPGVILSLVALAAKVITCFFPSYMVGFNKLGAMRIAFGMVPRGEMSLIIANIGMAYGFIDHKIFGIAILMVLLPTLLSTPIINLLLMGKKTGVKEAIDKTRVNILNFEIEYETMAKVLFWSLKNELKEQNFFTHQIKTSNENFLNAKRDDIAFTVKRVSNLISVECAESDSFLIQDIFRETIANLQESIKNIENLVINKSNLQYSKIYEIKQESEFDLKSLIKRKYLTTNIKAKTRNEIIRELVSILNISKKNLDNFIIKIIDREQIMSSCLKAEGVAIPHIKTSLVDEVKIAIGVSREGLPFYYDEEKKLELTNIFILAICPEKDYIRWPKMLSKILMKVNLHKEKIINVKNESELYEILVESK